MNSLSDYFSRYNRSEMESMCKDAFRISIIDLYSLYTVAWQDTVTYAGTLRPRYITRNTLPLKMYDNMVGGMYTAYPDLMREDREKVPYLQLAANLRVYPKKLNEKYVPSNVVTDHVKEKRGQLVFEDEQKIYVLYCGPVLTDEDWFIEPKGFFASFIHEYYPTRPEFVLDLQDYIKVPVVAVPQETQEETLVKVPGSDQIKKAE